jgi:structure-specific recognition protein 1
MVLYAYGTDKGFLFLLYFSSDKHLKILNLGDGQRRNGGVTAVIESTDDDSVDPHLERIKNQACNEESDEEVLPLLIG